MLSVPLPFCRGLGHWWHVPSISLQVCTFFITLSLLGIMWITGMCECLSWVLPSLSHWGSCGSLGCVSACHECSPPSRCRRWTLGQWVCSLHHLGGTSQTFLHQRSVRGGPCGSDGLYGGISMAPSPKTSLVLALPYTLTNVFSFRFFTDFLPLFSSGFSDVQCGAGLAPQSSHCASD
jgi:hypothetical protein